MTPRQVLLLFVAAFFWGSAYPFIGMALEGFAWTAVVFLRCVMAGAALLGVILLWGASTGRRSRTSTGAPVRPCCWPSPR